MIKLKQGTKVKYDVQTLKGTGTVVGVALIEQAITGSLYIIEPDIPISNDIYNYSHFCAWQNQLEVL